MSAPVREFEISALIDGELDAIRAKEVRAAVEQDPDLHKMFAYLEESDRAWAAAAKSAQFRPALSQYELTRLLRPVRVWAMAALAFVLVVARCFSKCAPLEPATAVLIHALMLVVVIVVTVRLMGRTVPEEDPTLPLAS